MYKMKIHTTSIGLIESISKRLFLPDPSYLQLTPSKREKLEVINESLWDFCELASCNNKKVCSKEGCTTKVHTAMSKHGTCWKHCPDNEMKISIIAKRKVYNSKEKKELQQTLPMCTSCGCRRVPNRINKHCCVCKKAK